MRRFRGVAASEFRLEGAAYGKAARDASDVEDLRRAVEAAQRIRRTAWLAFYRRLIVTTGAAFAEDGLPRRRRAVKPEPWGPGSSEWWTLTFRPQLGAEAWWDPWLKAMVRYADQTAAARVRDLDDATRRRVANIIKAGVKDGIGVAAVRDNIHAAYTRDFPKVRAEAIARTEVLTSARAGSYEATIALGVADQATKDWQDSGDILVRAEHREATTLNQGVPFDEPFRVRSPKTGAVQELRFPGDTSLGADASNTINCRCDVIVNPTTQP